MDYLVQSVPEFSNVELHFQQFPLHTVLKRLDDQPRESVQRLLLELLWRFECNWTAKNLPAKVLAINKEHGFLPDEVLRQAFDVPRARGTKKD